MRGRAIARYTTVGDRMNEAGGPALRRTNLEKLRSESFDVLVLGGGINGAVSAAALAARGARVALIDRGDFAGVTSQASSNLAWGGIKYLEILRVRARPRALPGRQRAAPVAIPRRSRRSGSTPRTRAVSATGDGSCSSGRGSTGRSGTSSHGARGSSPATTSAHEEPIVETATLDGGFEYSRRLLPRQRRAVRVGLHPVRPRSRLRRRQLRGGDRIARTRGRGGSPMRATSWAEGASRSGRASLVNACGPFADAMNAASGIGTEHHHVFSKGIHLLVDRLTPAPAGPHVLRGRRAPLLRDPHGPALLHRDDGYARGAAGGGDHGGGPPLRAR